MMMHKGCKLYLFANIFVKFDYVVLGVLQLKGEQMVFVANVVCVIVPNMFSIICLSMTGPSQSMEVA
jgi:hypothetical protein